jgi:hypothetical protein
LLRTATVSIVAGGFNRHFAELYVVALGQLLQWLSHMVVRLQLAADIGMAKVRTAAIAALRTQGLGSWWLVNAVTDAPCNAVTATTGNPYAHLAQGAHIAE